MLCTKEWRWTWQQISCCKWRDSGATSLSFFFPFSTLNFQCRILYSMKIYFKNKGKNEDVFTHIKARRIYYHHICTAENIRGNHLGKRRMILFYGKMKGNMDQHKEIKNTRNNYMGEYMIFFYLDIFKRLFKQN